MLDKFQDNDSNLDFMRLFAKAGNGEERCQEELEEFAEGKFPIACKSERHLLVCNSLTARRLRLSLTAAGAGGTDGGGRIPFV